MRRRRPHRHGGITMRQGILPTALYCASKRIHRRTSRSAGLKPHAPCYASRKKDSQHIRGKVKKSRNGARAAKTPSHATQAKRQIRKQMVHPSSTPWNGISLIFLLHQLPHRHDIEPLLLRVRQPLLDSLDQRRIRMPVDDGGATLLRHLRGLGQLAFDESRGRAIP